MCCTLVEALHFFKKNNNITLKLNCQNFVNAIRKNINQHEDSVCLESINDCIDTIIKELSEDDIDIEHIISLSEALCEYCKKEINYKIHVLFVAELGSKWDAMESVYNAMIQREDTIVTVVLEPIFRNLKLNDGTERTDIIYNDYLTDI